MVYRGRPSKGCEKCRKRRIRCDRKPKGCGNCARAGHVCPGYRSQLDLMFCDETATTVERHGGPHEAVDFAVTSSTPSSDGGDSPVPTPRGLSLPCLDDFALAYCYDRHLINVASSVKTLENRGVVSCLKALGMGSFSINTHSVELMGEASKYYVDAIQRTNLALTSPKDSLKDSTLFSVILLSYIESIMGKDTTSMTAWLHHIRGTALLVEMRGETQLHSKDGRFLFLLSCIWLVALGVRQQLGLPEGIIEMVYQSWMTSKPGVEPIWHVLYCNARLANFRHDITKGLAGGPDEIIQKAEDLDSELASAFDDAPSDWKYQIIADEDSDASSVPAYNFLFKHSAVAQTWNSMRFGRIALRLIIVAASQNPGSMLDSSTTLSKISDSQVQLRQLQMDILATVPQFLGNSNALAVGPYGGPLGTTVAPHSSIDFFQAGELCPEDLPLLWTSRGYLLMWNLRRIGEMNSPGTDLREAAIRFLYHLGNSLGMSQAFTHAKVLEQGMVHPGSPGYVFS